MQLKKGTKTRSKTKASENKDKSNKDIIRGTENTIVDNYTEEIWDLEDCTSTEILTQIIGEIQIN